MKVEIVSRETVKPRIPTAPHLEIHKLSLMDQLAPSIYIPILLFYSNRRSPLISYNLKNISKKLKNSLSETLNSYYPFAGRIEDEKVLTCKDEGVDFLEVIVESHLANLLRKPSPESLNILFPNNLQWKISKHGNLLAIQLSMFQCGGFSLGLCISHKIADACTISTFLNDWASLAHLGRHSVTPDWTSAISAFPPHDQWIVNETEPNIGNVVTRRFVFHPTKILELRNLVVSTSVQDKPTRVDVVTSFLYKAIVQAAKTRSSASQKPSLLAQTVNIRNKMAHPLPGNSPGNIVWFFPVIIKDEKDYNMGNLAAQMRTEFEKFCEFSRNVKGKEWFSIVSGSSSNSNDVSATVYKCSSWCRFPVYNVDFGWGKPAWVSSAECPFINNIILMDSNDEEGIEAWVALDKQVMDVLEGDEQFLKFVSSNPSIMLRVD